MRSRVLFKKQQPTGEDVLDNSKTKNNTNTLSVPVLPTPGLTNEYLEITKSDISRVWITVQLIITIENWKIGTFIQTIAW